MPKTAKTERPDIYATVTNQIIASLEAGVTPWTQPWQNLGKAGVGRPLRHNLKPYTGINVFLLWATAVERGYTSPIWLTYNQAKAEGAQVRGGEKGTLVIYASVFKKDVKNEETGKIENKIFRFLKGYTVFNLAQIDNLPAKYAPKPEPTEQEAVEQHVERIAHAEEFFAATGAKINHGGDQAFYSPASDYIQLPEIEQFKDLESYYATLGHESVHWTRHETRLNRSFGREKWGDEGYAKEELVAELGAAFLCADLGITLEPREDHAGYLANWLKVLKGDKRFIVQAASFAQKACDYLHAFSDPATETEADEVTGAEAVEA